MQDPTRGEMVDFLSNAYGSDADKCDIAEAIYWFAYDYHGGQWSNLYSALCTSPFSPGPIANGCEPGSLAAMMYEDLEAEYV